MENLKKELDALRKGTDLQLIVDKEKEILHEFFAKKKKAHRVIRNFQEKKHLIIQSLKPNGTDPYYRRMNALVEEAMVSTKNSRYYAIEFKIPKQRSMYIIIQDDMLSLAWNINLNKYTIFKKL